MKSYEIRCIKVIGIAQCTESCTELLGVALGRGKDLGTLVQGPLFQTK